MLAVAMLVAGCAQPLPEVRVSADNVRIERSCRVVIAEDAVIADADGDGVIHIVADDVTVEFAESSVLRGRGLHFDDHLIGGIGVRIDGRRGVTLRGARVEGFKIGVLASGCDGLVIEDARLDHLYRPRLESTPRRADEADRLRLGGAEPAWRALGAGVVVEDSPGAVIRRVEARGAQGGVAVTGSDGARVYDSDCSFMSGWGIAVRDSKNAVVCRNAADFCVRGYSHGVYLEDHGAAGIVLIGDCDGAVVAHNSATHGGCGLMVRGEIDLGCNGVVILSNDFSSAAGAGMEIRGASQIDIVGNVVVDSGGAGVRLAGVGDALVRENRLERSGGVVMSSCRGGVVVANRLQENRIGIDIRGSAAGDTTAVQANFFNGSGAVIRLEDAGDVAISANGLGGVEPRVDDRGGTRVLTDGAIAQRAMRDAPELPGESAPIGRRSGLDGRGAIVMGDYGPWDHRTPMMRLVERRGDRDEYEILGDPGPLSLIGFDGTSDIGTVMSDVEPGVPRTMAIAVQPGVTGLRAYECRVMGLGLDHLIRGTLFTGNWTVRIFGWDDTSDPRRAVDAWRAAGMREDVAIVSTGRLDTPWLRFGERSPRDMEELSAVRERLRFGGDRFGIIATTRVDIAPGRWRFSVHADDGFRVLIDGKSLVERWGDDGAHEAQAVHEQREGGTVDITVEYYEVEGPAHLRLTIDADRP